MVELGDRTLAAFDTTTGGIVTFHDYVKDGDLVPVYRTFEAAAEERGPFRMMRVVKGAEDWLLEPSGPLSNTPQDQAEQDTPDAA